MGFPRQEHWSGATFSPPGNLPNTGIKPTSLASPALAGRYPTTSAIWKAPGVKVLHTHYLFLLDTKLYCMWSLLTELSVENVSVSDVFLLNDELIIQRLENMITVSTY